MQLLDAGPVALATALRRREVGSEELVRSYLARIERHDPRLGAFVALWAQDALADARHKDARPGDAPFWGVPIGIKDLNFVRGRVTRMGTRALPPLWSPVDDRTVTRLRRAGFVLMGKTATSEVGAMPVTEPDGRPPSRNPWDLARTPGGSSGGSAAAVAGGLLPVGHGSDGGGSIRIPASFCGLVGLKAGRGVVANAFGDDRPDLLYTCGVLTRDVADTAALLDVLATAPLPPPRTGPLRIRVVLDVPFVPTDPGVRAEVLAVAEALAGMGHAVEEAPGPVGDLDEFLPVWQRLVGTFWFLPWARTQPPTRWLGQSARGLPKGLAVARQAELTARWLAWQEGCDVLLTPTVAVPPPPVGSYAGPDGEAAFRAAAALAAFTAPFNVTGQPAISVPAGLHPTLGVPVGVQFVGPHGGEATLLALARSVEEARPWARVPPGYDT